MQKRKLGILLSCCLAAVLSVTGLIAVINLSQANSRATSYYRSVTVGEIVDNLANLQLLYNYICGKDKATYADIQTKAKRLSEDGMSKRWNAYEMTEASGGGKSSGAIIIVTFGGRQWHTCLLSTSRSGDPVLTLMLCEAFASVEYNVGGYNDYSSGEYACIYGTSYARAYLNNQYGSQFVNRDGELEHYTSSNSYFMKEFLTGGAYADYIVTPAQMAWQETESSRNDYAAGGINWGRYVCPNDAYGTPSSGEFCNYSDDDYEINYSAKCQGTNYEAWKNDYLWLPSITETGYAWDDDDDWDEEYGLFGFNAGQRQQDADYAWLRSAERQPNTQTAKAYVLTSDDDPSGIYPRNVDEIAGLRPCLHLNLAKFVDPADNHVLVGEIYDNETNLQTLYDYLAGESNVAFSKLKSMAWWEYNAKNFRYMSCGAKKAGQDIQVTFGGKVWHVCYLSQSRKKDVVLTLMLKDTFGRCKYGEQKTDGVQNNPYPFNMYGSSYIRAYLNNTGYYTTDSKTLTPYAGSPIYQMIDFCADGKYADFLVKPAQIAWQETESAFSWTPWPYSFPNDAYGTPRKELCYISSGTKYDWSKYEQKPTYSDWKNDLLWLPSVAEVGFGASGDVGKHYSGEWDMNVWSGLWRLNQLQRNCEKDNETENYWWMRSADDDCVYRVRILEKDLVGTTYESNANNELGVRPCIHLNLSIFSESPAITDEEVYYTGRNVSINELPEAQRPSWLRDYMTVKYLQNGVETTQVVEPGRYVMRVEYGTNVRQVNLVVRKAKINVSINNISSQLNQDLQKLSANISGEVVQGLLWSDLVKLSTTANKNVAGKYRITATPIDEEHYEVEIVKDGVYTVGDNSSEIIDAYDEKLPSGWTGIDPGGGKDMTVKPET